MRESCGSPAFAGMGLSRLMISGKKPSFGEFWQIQA
jgi:hypothetical protein